MEIEESEPKKSFIRRFWWLIIILAIILLGIIFYIVKPPKNNSQNDTALSQNLIQADFIDLDRIYSISKFRSGSGHDFSQGSDETCRSMKHYFNVLWTREGQNLVDQNNGIPPKPDGKNDINIYSPVDGKVASIPSEQMPIGEQINIEPDSDPSLTIRLFHVYKLEGIKKGSTLKAGQKIGVISQHQNTDIALIRRKGFKTQYLSYFNFMPDSIFAKYQARGVKTRDDLIITKEYRDANPLKCNGEKFAENYDTDSNSPNFVYLSGYSSER